MRQRIPTPSDFLHTIQGPRRKTSASRPIRLATVDPAYDHLANWPGAAPPARVTFEGETVLSAKAYPIADGFVPAPGNRVWLEPIGNTYLICGSIEGPDIQGFWQDQGAGSSGVEFGGGSYYDSDEGLNIAHDAAIAGTLTAGARMLPVVEVQMGQASLTFAVAAAAQTLTVNFPVAWPPGTTPIVMCNVHTTTGGLPLIMPKVTVVTNTSFNLNMLKTDAAQANFTLSAYPVDWVAFATP